MKRIIRNSEEMNAFGQLLGRAVRGGEVLELVGDVGAGKTTLTKGIAAGMGIREPVQSPTFTISRVYAAGDLELRHYDFYRLSEAGVMADELAEATGRPEAVTIVEWGDVVADVLPTDTLRIEIAVRADDSREVNVAANGERSEKLYGKFTEVGK